MGSHRGGVGSRQPPWAHTGQGRHTQRGSNRRGPVNKAALTHAIPNETMLHWMQMMTQGLHQTMGQNRKVSGACFDTWLFPATHTIAATLMAAHVEF